MKTKFKETTASPKEKSLGKNNFFGYRWTLNDRQRYTDWFDTKFVSIDCGQSPAKLGRKRRIYFEMLRVFMVNIM
jgi:hypothetical protein